MVLDLLPGQRSYHWIMGNPQRATVRSVAVYCLFENVTLLNCCHCVNHDIIIFIIISLCFRFEYLWEVSSNLSRFLNYYCFWERWLRMFVEYEENGGERDIQGCVVTATWLVKTLALTPHSSRNPVHFQTVLAINVSPYWPNTLMKNTPAIYIK